MARIHGDRLGRRSRAARDPAFSSRFYARRSTSARMRHGRVILQPRTTGSRPPRESWAWGWWGCWGAWACVTVRGVREGAWACVRVRGGVGVREGAPAGVRPPARSCARPRRRCGSAPREGGRALALRSRAPSLPRAPRRPPRTGLPAGRALGLRLVDQVGLFVAEELLEELLQPARVGGCRRGSG